MKYCINCKQLVDPQKKFNSCLFIVLLFTLLGWVFYLIYYAVKPKKCPMCNSTNWGVKPPETQHQSPVVNSQQTSIPQTQPITEGFKFCVQCGEKIESNIQFCSSCGTKQ